MELVGHGHAHGQHRIFSTNVIEVGLFKFVVPFRWASSGAGEEDAAEQGEIAVKRKKETTTTTKKKKNKASPSTSVRAQTTLRRSRAGRGVRNRPRDAGGDESHLVDAEQMRLKPHATRGNRKRDEDDGDASQKGEKGHAEPENRSENDSIVQKGPLLLLPLNETLVAESNVTALPARRLLEKEKRSKTWFRGLRLGAKFKSM